MMSERWRPVKGYEGHYAVSDQGRVKSVRRVCRVYSKSRGKFYDQQLQNRILKPQPTGPSPTVALYRDAKRHQVCISRLGREAFGE